MKNMAIALVILLLGFVLWTLFHSSDIAVVVNGQRLVGPLKFAAEGWGLLVAVVALFSAAILLVFVFTGLGVMILGLFMLGGFVAAWIAFPFLLPLLVPLCLVWSFIAATRSRGGSGA